MPQQRGYMKRLLFLSILLALVGCATRPAKQSGGRQKIPFTVLLVPLGSNSHPDVIGVTVSLDSGGRFWDKDGHALGEEGLHAILQGNPAPDASPICIDLEVTGQQSISLSSLKEHLKRLRRNADPSKDTIVYIYLEAFDRE
jgi:hypothetical protein